MCEAERRLERGVKAIVARLFCEVAEVVLYGKVDMFNRSHGYAIVTDDSRAELPQGRFLFRQIINRVAHLVQINFRRTQFDACSTTSTRMKMQMMMVAAVL